MSQSKQFLTAISDSLASFIPPATQKLAIKLANSKHVRLLPVENDTLRGEVDYLGRSYSVKVSLIEPTENFECACQAHERSVVCAHLFAAVLFYEKQQSSDSSPSKSSPFSARKMESPSRRTSSISRAHNILNSLREVLARMETIKKAEPTESDAAKASNDLRRDAASPQAPEPTKKKGSRSKATSGSKAPPTPTWQKLIDDYQRPAHVPKARKFYGWAYTEHRLWKDAVFVLDITDSTNLKLPAFIPLRKRIYKSGEVKWTFENAPLDETARLSPPVVANVAGMLNALHDEALQIWELGDRRHYYTSDHYYVSPDAQDGFMFNLIESGKGAWGLNPRQTLEFNRLSPGSWQKGTFAVDLVRSEKGTHWTMVPKIYDPRIGVRELKKAVVTFPGGSVLWEDGWTAGLSANEGRWAKTFESNNEVVISDEQLNAAIEHWSSLPAAPTIHWPAHTVRISDEPLPSDTTQVPVITWNRDAESKNRWNAFASVSYGEHRFEVGRTEVDGDSATSKLPTRSGIHRDHRAEAELFRKGVDRFGGQVPEVTTLDHDWLSASLQPYGVFETQHPNRAVNWLGTVKDPQLLSVCTQLIADGYEVHISGERLRSSGKLSVSVRSGIDWFDVDCDMDFGGVSADLPELLKSARLGRSTVRLNDGTIGMLNPEALQRLKRMLDHSIRNAARLDAMDDDADLDASDASIDPTTLRFAGSQAMLLDALLDADQTDVQLDEHFFELINKLRNVRGIAPAKASKGFQGELREYQEAGLGWFRFLQEHRFGGCLADDMGLGKTIQVLALLETRRAARTSDPTIGPSIVVVPKSLLFNWQAEAAKFAPQLKVHISAGTDRKANLDQLDQFDVVLTTYQTLIRDILKLRSVKFDYVILDEAQAIKNSTAQVTKACRLLNGTYRLALTGTPIENHLGELWSLFEFLNPGMLGRSATFARMTGGKVSDETTQFIAKAISPYVLRRTKRQVLTELPEKTQNSILCELGPKQRKLYDQLRDHYRARVAGSVAQVGVAKSQFLVLEALLRLRQAACHPGLLDGKKAKHESAKFEELLSRLPELIENGHKALVFSQFTSLFDLLKPELDRQGIRYEYLDGSTRNRQARVESFQNSPDIPLFLISLKAGGHGLNLTSADYVFLLDPWWNPAVEAQAIDRAHRMGQTKPVFAYRLIAKDTIEEKIATLQETKRQLADSVITENENAVLNLSFDDLQLLLS